MTTGRPLSILALFLACAALTAEAPRVLRVPVWVFLEPVPGKFEDGKGTETTANGDLPPATELRSVARFVLGGMVYGWRFYYEPGDRTRRVEESFSLEPVAEIPEGDARFSVAGVDPAYPRVSAWAEFAIDGSAARRRQYWDSVQFRSADGRGYGALERESAGIRDAYSDAVRAAVRAYARKLEKNKPKEIRGEVLLRETPRLFTEAGRYVADITVLVNLVEITPYATF